MNETEYRNAASLLNDTTSTVERLVRSGCTHEEMENAVLLRDAVQTKFIQLVKEATIDEQRQVLNFVGSEQRDGFMEELLRRKIRDRLKRTLERDDAIKS